MLTRMVSISWPRDPPASASQSAGITGLSHRARPLAFFNLEHPTAFFVSYGMTVLKEYSHLLFPNRRVFTYACQVFPYDHIGVIFLSEYCEGDTVSFSGSHIWRHWMPICPSLMMWILISWSRCCSVFFHCIVIIFSLAIINNLWGHTLMSCKYLVLVKISS